MVWTKIKVSATMLRKEKRELCLLITNCDSKEREGWRRDMFDKVGDREFLFVLPKELIRLRLDWYKPNSFKIQIFIE